MIRNEQIILHCIRDAGFQCTAKKARDFWVHSTLLLDESTTQTIGLIQQDWWKRPNVADKSEEKESGNWVDSLSISDSLRRKGIASWPTVWVAGQNFKRCSSLIE